jgi:hypothetical protein
VTTAGRSGGFWQVQGIEEIKLLGGGLAQAVEAARAGVGGVFLDARQQRERAARVGTVPLGLQPHAHDAVEDERQEADQGVGADAVGQPMVNRRDRYVGFEDAEAALDVGEALVAGDGLGGGEVRGVGDQGELAIEELGLGNGAGEAAVGAAVGGAAPLGGLARVLRIEFADHLLGHGVELSNAGAPAITLFSGTKWIIGDDQAMASEGRLGHAVFIEGEAAECLDQFAVAPGGDGEDELERPAAPGLLRQGRQLADVLEAEKPAIGHEDDALDREALQDGRQHGLQGLRLGHVARVNGMHERQPIGGLRHAEHELARDPTGLLVHAIGAEIVVNSAFTMDPHRGQIVEDDGQVVIHERPDLPCQLALDPVGMIDQRVHRPQQVLVGGDLRHCRHGHRFQPPQASKLGVRFAEPIEDHGAHQRLDIHLPLPRAQGPRERPVEPEILPQLVQREDIAEGARRVVRELAGGVLKTTDRPVEAIDQRVEHSGRDLVEPPEVGDDLDANLAFFVAVPLDELEIAAAARCCDARVHWTNDMRVSAMPSSRITRKRVTTTLRWKSAPSQPEPPCFIDFRAAKPGSNQGRSVEVRLPSAVCTSAMSIWKNPMG